jgi:hypothetical protein
MQGRRCVFDAFRTDPDDPPDDEGAGRSRPAAAGMAI